MVKRQLIIGCFFVIGLFAMTECGWAQSAGKDLTSPELREAKKMSEMYAKHLFASTCFETQMSYRTGRPTNKKDMVAYRKKMKDVCDCLSAKAVKELPSESVIEYVTEEYGTKTPVFNKDGKQMFRKQPDMSDLERQNRMKFRLISSGSKALAECGIKR